MTRCLEDGTDPNARTKYGGTPLHIAAWKDSAAAVAALPTPMHGMKSV
ncbi:MAG: ankyrin repeat domain-containing protein [Rhodospirillales bacterium]|nr:ankyrin repeat domain-containing protein [Rhodospirillales bacterium]